VAAFEIPLSSEADRDQFLAVLRAAAAPEGMQVDAESSEGLKADAKVSPNFEMTMRLRRREYAVRRGVSSRITMFTCRWKKSPMAAAASAFSDAFRANCGQKAIVDRLCVRESLIDFWIRPRYQLTLD
jgi:hypothetical protein